MPFCFDYVRWGWMNEYVSVSAPVPVFPKSKWYLRSQWTKERVRYTTLLFSCPLQMKHTMKTENKLFSGHGGWVIQIKIDFRMLLNRSSYLVLSYISILNHCMWLGHCIWLLLKYAPARKKRIQWYEFHWKAPLK